MRAQLLLSDMLVYPSKHWRWLLDTERDLLAAVLNEPDEDRPRLDYAEWCDRQDDPPTRARGEFIRVQIDLAKVGEGTDPSREYSLRYASERMAADHGRLWAGEIAELVDTFHFDRGFVELVGLSAEDFLQRAQLLYSLAPIRHLDLSGWPGMIPELFATRHLRGIRSLRLEAWGLTDAHVELLVSSPNLSELRWLSLAENRIGMAGAKALAASPFLGKLRYASFFRNLVEPNEQYSYDNGFVVDAWLPEDGLRLEREHGHLPWLHHDAKSIADSVPDRFRIEVF